VVRWLAGPLAWPPMYSSCCSWHSVRNGLHCGVRPCNRHRYGRKCVALFGKQRLGFWVESIKRRCSSDFAISRGYSADAIGHRAG
jgi:hypothetical protein